MKQSAKANAARCLAQGRSKADRDRCVLPVGAAGHDMAQTHRGELALPVLIHRDESGNEWTIHGVFVRQQTEEAS